MKIFIENKTIYSVDNTEFETTWKIEDFPFVLKYLQKLHIIVLGGDILNEKMQYTYDNWYYDIDKDIDYQDNVVNSIEFARDYLTKYTKRYGNCFNVIFITEDYCNP